MNPELRRPIVFVVQLLGGFMEARLSYDKATPGVYKAMIGVE
jgi:hypothetical protein